MTTQSTPALPDRVAVVIGLFALGVLMLLLTTWSGEEVPAMTVEAAGELARSLPWTLAWLIAAFGFGRPLVAWLVPHMERSTVVHLGLGIALLLWLDTLLGRLGVMQLGGAIGAWLVLIVGWGIAITQCLRFWRNSQHVSPGQQLPLPHWLTWTAVPALAVLAIAALSAPGWLWRTEFGGYDVLSYHLQLPAEWLELDRIAPLEHNVYSFLPNFTEAAYYHLAVLAGDAVRASAACQLLHASFVIVTAILIARFLTPLVGRIGGAIGAVIFLGTPWIIVTGSLAYNEMAVTLMLALGLCVLREVMNGSKHTARHSDVSRRIRLWKIGATIGILAAVACGAKLSALGFAAIPLGVAMLAYLPWRTWPPAVGAGIVAGTIVLAPWLIDNARASSNPVFPFMTNIFGTGHWNEQQVAAWNEGHFGPGSISERMTEAWRQLPRYGLGESPYPETEPWLPQWSILPWLLVPALAIIVALRDTRRWGVLLLVIVLLQLAFWIAATHVKARFMIPIAVPAAIAIGASAAWLLSMATRGAALRLSRLAVAVALVVWCALPIAISRDEGGGAPAARLGFANFLTGDALTPREREAIGRRSLPAVYVNYMLPEASRVLFIGEAAPFYYGGEYVYTTTWDRGPFSTIMREHEDDAEEWIRALREEHEFTHVLVNPVMLDVWQRAGWNDPLLTSERVLGALEQHAQRINTWQSGERMYRLR